MRAVDGADLAALEVNSAIQQMGKDDAMPAIVLARATMDAAAADNETANTATCTTSTTESMPQALESGEALPDLSSDDPVAQLDNLYARYLHLLDTYVRARSRMSQTLAAVCLARSWAL